MIYLQLIFEFFKIGLFSFGGGYATIPFLYYISQEFHWFSSEELTQMIAVASITPGPVGINVATYAGLKTGGLIAAFLGTASVIIPAFFIVIFVSKLLRKYKDNYYVTSILEILKPTSCALLSVVVFELVYTTLIKQSINQISSIVLFLSLLFVQLLIKNR